MFFLRDAGFPMMVIGLGPDIVMRELSAAGEARGMRCGCVLDSFAQPSLVASRPDRGA